eukprot:TRINITY_DN4042_c0_g1_i2.p1 TRINITY_DN4042_c0_g1~~TRINITY_DN4042_c0_g1_i2.p1  ORF type:complete len:394 (-),score=55.08 TRINITY_DN4042_c0_g1_i2:33-1214(-)
MEFCFDVAPSHSIGPFVIGMKIHDALSRLQSMMPEIEAKLIYSTGCPLAVDTTIDLDQIGIKLYFCPITQRLRVIDAYDMAKVALAYEGSSFSGDIVTSTFLLVYELFGPTFPGTWDPESKQYFLHYRGISFCFSIPERYRELYVGPHEDIPLQLPDGSTPRTQRVLIYGGTDLKNPILPPIPKASFFFEPILVTISEDTTLHFLKRKQTLHLGDSLQRLASVLGPPDKIFWKTQNKLNIHSKPDSAKRSRAPPFDFFYNYFSLGVDFLLCAHTNTIKKIILHTNFPGHSEFNHYNRCNFRLRFDKSSVLIDDDSNSLVTNTKGSSMITTSPPSSSSSSVATTSTQSTVTTFSEEKPESDGDKFSNICWSSTVSYYYDAISRKSNQVTKCGFQ